MIDVCLVAVGKVAANMILEICSHKSSIILTSRDQNSKKKCMEVLHDNYLFSVIFALYTGFSKSLCEVSAPGTSECCGQTWLYCIDGA